MKRRDRSTREMSVMRPSVQETIFVNFQGIRGMKDLPNGVISSPETDLHGETWKVNFRPSARSAGSDYNTGNHSLSIELTSNGSLCAGIDARVFRDQKRLHSIGKHVSEIRRFGPDHRVEQLDRLFEFAPTNDDLYFTISITLYENNIRTSSHRISPHVHGDQSRCVVCGGCDRGGESVSDGYIASLLYDETFSDLTIKASDGEYLTAHKLVLGMCSDTLKLNLCGPNVRELDFSQYDADSLRMFLEYAYTGNIRVGRRPICMANLEVLYTLASAFDINGLKELCEDNWAGWLQPHSVVSILRVAERLRSTRLRWQALTYIGENREQVVNLTNVRPVLTQYWAAEGTALGQEGEDMQDKVAAVPVEKGSSSGPSSDGDLINLVQALDGGNSAAPVPTSASAGGGQGAALMLSLQCSAAGTTTNTTTATTATATTATAADLATADQVVCSCVRDYFMAVAGVSASDIMTLRPFPDEHAADPAGIEDATSESDWADLDGLRSKKMGIVGCGASGDIDGHRRKKSRWC